MLTRRSGTDVRRTTDGRHVLKTATTPEARWRLVDERDRLTWLQATGMETAAVADWQEASDGWTLVTTAVPGIPATEVPPDRVGRAISSMAMYLTDLHALPPDGCPFDRRLEITVPEATHRTAEGLVDETDLDLVPLGRTAVELLEELHRGALRASVEEDLDLVVCHGDFSLANVLVDEQTHDVTGVVDVGRLGLADCHADLALLTRSMASRHGSLQYGPVSVQRLLAMYPVEADPWRLDFYRLLDEFF